MNNTNNNGNAINKNKETSGLKNDTKSNKSNSNGNHKHNKNTSKQNVKLHQTSTSSSNNSSTNANHPTATNNNNKQNAKQNEEDQDMLGKSLRQTNRTKSESETVNKGGKGYYQHTVAGGFSKETNTKINTKQTNKTMQTKVYELINEIIQEKESTNNPESIKRTVSKTAVVSVQNITNENGLHEATAPQTNDFEIELANNYMTKVKKVS
jgi:hypothetical protein